jgi:AraC-like DNA-binding protein
VGIAHAEYLNVMFKDVVGMTPGAYRKKFASRL